MADPVKKTKENPVEVTQAPPTTAQEAEVRMIQNNQAQAFKSARTGAPTAVLPFGQRIDATPHIKARYRNAKMADVLANPESILTEEWIRQHRGWKYEWPVRGKMDTTAYVNSQRYKLVPYEAVDKRNHHAMVMQSPEGNTVWMQHVLVAVSPEVHYEEKQMPVEDYLGKMAMNRRMIEQEINQSFGSSGYRADIEYGTDRKQERH